MTVSIVDKSVFGNVFERIDAEYVEQEVLNREAKVRSKFDGNNINEVVFEITTSDRTINNREDSVVQAINYIAIDSVDIEDGLTFSTKYDRVEDLPGRAEYVLRPKDILVSNVRPNRGAIALIRHDQDEFIASSGFTLLRVKPGAGFAPNYVFAFLKTPYAREQLVRRGRGSMYPAVVREDVLDIFIPKPTPKVRREVLTQIALACSLQVDFVQKKLESKALLTKLLTDIGSPPSPVDTRKKGIDWTEVHASSMLHEGGPQRLDAEFFRSEYQDFDKRCSDLGPSFLLGERFQLSPGRGLNRTAGTAFLAKQGILTNVGINWGALEEADGQAIKEGWKVQNGDILLACTAHEIAYVGRKCDVVTEIPLSIDADISCVPDLMILRRRAKDPGYISLHYVAAFLRHQAGLHQVQRCIRGLRGGHVYKNDLERFVRIPLPKDSWMETFDSIEGEAERIRNQAKIAVAKAVSCVSEMIAD